MEATITNDIYENLDRLHVKEIISKDSRHFCTVSSDVINRNNETIRSIDTSPTLKICEKYKPSYTSKKDQINVISDRIKMIRQSKQLMRDTMKEIDSLLDDKYKVDENKCNYETLEEFFKSKKCINSSLSISSMNSNLPRKDINPPKYIDEVNKQFTKTEKADMKARNVSHPVLVSTSIFEPFNKFTFTDKSLLENRQKFLENKKRNQLNKRILSAGFSLVRNGKSESDRSTNIKTKKVNVTKSRINSAH